MRAKVWGVAGALGVAFVAACQSFGMDDDPVGSVEAPDGSVEAPDGSVMGGDASVDSGKVGSPPAPCDAKAEPRDPASCLTDEYGVFVNGIRGDDANDGSRAAPVRTIHRALEVAGTRQRLYVCGTSYAESVSLTKPIHIYGGFDCDTWSYTGQRAVIAPKITGYALDVQRVEPEIVIADVEAVSRPGVAGNVSSVAVRAAWSHVRFVRGRFSAGAGFRGADGEAGTPAKLVSVSSGELNYDGNDWAEDPNDESYLPPGITPKKKICTCSAGEPSTGGAGGEWATNGERGSPVYAPNSDFGKGGKSDNAVCFATPESGFQGDHGRDSDTVASSPSRIGSITNGEWIPEPGLEGLPGMPGQGGGGGGGAGIPRAQGGGGACGGCGGLGGKGGGGGGASVALLSVGSTVRIELSDLVSDDAGAGGGRGVGGQGADGGKGGQPGPGFSPSCTRVPGAPGGNGGKGGRGGDGSGGAGGVSAAIFYSGAEPVVDDATTLKHGAAGAAGKGSVVAGSSNAGLPGVAGARVKVPE